jgi:isoleucyl-tRNA synthetase
MAPAQKGGTAKQATAPSEAGHAQKVAKGGYDPTVLEPEVVAFWQKNDIYDKLRKRNSKGKKWTFLQGPPYTSGRLHMGHAWNHALKDMAMRYKRMQGFDVWDRAGYDMHGLPTENKVQEKFKLKDKDAIKKFGYDRFAEECHKFAVSMAKLMDKDLFRIGVWMDYSDPYYPVSNDFMETEWWFVKQAHEKGRLYRSERTLAWCAFHGTALAKHEQEYKEVTDTSIFLKFKVKGTANDYFIVWTTTPWTIAYNMGIMVNPDIDYVRAKVDNEYWIVAKPLIGVLVNGLLGKNFEILSTMKGDSLAGKGYEHPWTNELEELKALKAKNPKIHTVLLSSEYVDTSAGTGLVHTAPGCGPEDYEVGYRNGIPPFNNLSETGVFPKGMGRFSGLVAKKDDQKFIDAMKHDGFLIESSPVSHEYAHCQRCGNPVIFRTTKQWFFKAEDLIPVILKNNEQVRWVPRDMNEAFRGWITNLRDNSITKQRFWGTPVPIWKCDKCQEISVIGSARDLKERAIGNAIPKDLHKPWIDDVKLTCPKCKGTMTRFEDIIDVWVDSGVTQWACFYYPQRADLYDKYFPVDFILEAKEQVRLWFYMLSLCQAMVTGKQPYKNVYCTGMLLSVEGVKMSKSLGNIISPYTIIDEHGADTMRWYLSSIDAALNVSFSWKEIETKKRNLLVLWNIKNFVLDLAKQAGVNPATLDRTVMLTQCDVAERYILSAMNSATRKATVLFDDYLLDQVPAVAENLWMELSRTYIQLIRDKAGEEDERKVVLFAAYNALVRVLELFAPVCPFITETIWQELRKEFALKEESVHLLRWPQADDKLVDDVLEDNMRCAQQIMQAALFAREKVQRGVRWPLPRVYVITQSESHVKAVEQLRDVIAQQVNVKQVVLQPDLPEVKETITINKPVLGKSFGKDAPAIQKELGAHNLADVLRQIRAKGTFKLSHGATGKNVAELSLDHFNVSRSVPEHLVEVSFPSGQLYLDIEINEALESEGFSRELTRRIQQLRKDAGLTKAQSILCHVKTSAAMAKRLQPHIAQMQAKVNAQDLVIDDQQHIKKYKHAAEAKVKDQAFAIAFDVV